MTLDEAEATARSIVAVQEKYGAEFPSEMAAGVLARALLAILPVVKAAEAWRDQHRRRWEQTVGRSPDPLYVHVPDDVLELADALAAMRARMGEK